MNWGFESGTTEGWVTDPISGGGVTNISVSTTHFHSGSRALAVSMGLGAYSVVGQQSGASVEVPICANGTVNLSGWVFSAWVYFTLTNGAITQYRANLVSAWLEDSSAVRGSTYGDAPTQVAVSQTNLNTWMQIRGVVSQPSSANDVAGLSVGFTFADPSEGYQGTMYIDDVQISPP